MCKVYNVYCKVYIVHCAIAYCAVQTTNTDSTWVVGCELSFLLDGLCLVVYTEFSAIQMEAHASTPSIERCKYSNTCTAQITQNVCSVFIMELHTAHCIVKY